MHSVINSGSQLPAHSIHTWAGYRHWQSKSALLNAERTHARGEAARVATRRAAVSASATQEGGVRGPTGRARFGEALVPCRREQRGA